MMLIGMLNTLFVFDEPPYQVVAPEGADKLKEFIVWFLSSRKIRLYVQGNQSPATQQPSS